MKRLVASSLAFALLLLCACTSDTPPIESQKASPPPQSEEPVASDSFFEPIGDARGVDGMDPYCLSNDGNQYIWHPI